jgi:hypothetical protein
MEINKYHDQKHYEDVSAAVDGDPRIEALFEEFLGLFEQGNAPQKDTYLRML